MDRIAGCASPQLLVHALVAILVYVTIYVAKYVTIYVYSYISMYMYRILLGRWKTGRHRSRNQGNTTPARNCRLQGWISLQDVDHRGHRSMYVYMG
jgi:hypothetical protein